VNDKILQIIADIFEIDVMQSSITNTAASGAAIRAKSSYQQGSIEQNTLVSSKTIKPKSENFLIYRKLFSRYGKLESDTASILNNK
jgi:sugar (pentulose or hexulose) kinase